MSNSGATEAYSGALDIQVTEAKSTSPTQGSTEARSSDPSQALTETRSADPAQGSTEARSVTPDINHAERWVGDAGLDASEPFDRSGSAIDTERFAKPSVSDTMVMEARASSPNQANTEYWGGIPSGTVLTERWAGFPVENITEPFNADLRSLLADSIEALSELTAPLLGQVHTLFAISVEATAELAELGQIRVLNAVDAEALSELTQPALAQVHNLLAASVESASYVAGAGSIIPQIVLMGYSNGYWGSVNQLPVFGFLATPETPVFVQDVPP